MPTIVTFILAAIQYIIPLASIIICQTALSSYVKNAQEHGRLSDLIWERHVFVLLFAAALLIIVIPYAIGLYVVDTMDPRPRERDSLNDSLTENVHSAVPLEPKTANMTAFQRRMYNFTGRASLTLMTIEIFLYMLVLLMTIIHSFVSVTPEQLAQRHAFKRDAPSITSIVLFFAVYMTYYFNQRYMLYILVDMLGPTVPRSLIDGTASDTPEEKRAKSKLICNVSRSRQSLVVCTSHFSVTLLYAVIAVAGYVAYGDKLAMNLLNSDIDGGFYWQTTRWLSAFTLFLFAACSCLTLVDESRKYIRAGWSDLHNHRTKYGLLLASFCSFIVGIPTVVALSGRDFGLLLSFCGTLVGSLSILTLPAYIFRAATSAANVHVPLYHDALSLFVFGLGSIFLLGGMGFICTVVFSAIAS